MFTSRSKTDRETIIGDGSMRTSRAAAVVVVMLTTVACEIDSPEFRDRVQLASLDFELHSENVGVHPFQDVLNDPNNPFRRFGVGSETKFDILAGASTPGAFYAWATLLATQPNGEHQFYTAQLMEVLAGTRSGEERFVLEQLAIRGYQAVLDFFPGDVSFLDENLLSKFRVATPSYFGIIRLGGQVQGNWVAAVDSNGNEEAILASPPIFPDPDPNDDDDEEDEEDEGS